MTHNPLKRTPKRIALAGDWHTNASYATWTIREAAAAGAEGIIQLGDFGIWPGHVGSMFLKSVSQALIEAQIWGAFIDGNHEDFWQLNAMPLDKNGLRPVRANLWHLPRGLRWVWNEQTWLALGGAVSLDRKQRKLGRSWWPEETITAGQIEHVLAGGRADVMLTHDCPEGVNIPGLLPDSCWDADQMRNARAHRALMRSIVDEVGPSRIYHGHFHVAYTSEAVFARGRCVVQGLGYDGCPLEESLILVDL